MDICSSNLFWLQILVMVVSLLLFIRRRSKKTNLPPSPARLPFIGHLHHILFSTPHIAFHRLSLRYGPLMFLQLGTLPAIVISSAEVLRDVLRTHDIIFSNKPVMTATWKLSYGGKDMAASQYNDPWKQMKKVTMLGLLSMRRIKLGRSVRVSEIGTVLEAITRQIPGDPYSKSKGFNFSEMMNELTNRIVCRIAFGIRNDKKQYQESRLYKLLRETQWLMGGFFVGDYFPWLKWVHIFTGQQRRLQNNFKELDQYYTKVISQHIDDLNSFGNQKDHEDDGDYDLLHTVLQLRDGSGEANVFNDMDYVKGLMTVSQTLDHIDTLELVID